MYEHLFSLHTFLPCHPYIFSFLILYMWQSRVKTEHYSIAYFDRITTFEEL